MQFELPLMHLQHKSRGMYFGISKLRILYKRVLLVQPKKKKKVMDENDHKQLQNY